jgi:hypothetical protein
MLTTNAADMLTFNAWQHPAHGTVYSHYAAWRDEGIFARLNHELTGLARVMEGRKPEPTACVIDTQSVKTSTNVPLASQGTCGPGERGPHMDRELETRTRNPSSGRKPLRRSSSPCTNISHEFLAQDTRACIEVGQSHSLIAAIWTVAS